MFHFKLYEHKQLYGMTYTFPKRGDGIGMHTHTEDQKHNCVVLKGSVEVYGPNKEWSVTLKAGDIFDLEDKHHPHEVAALEDDTVLLGMFVNGRPQGEYLPEEDKTGTIDWKPITIPLSADSNNDSDTERLLNTHMNSNAVQGRINTMNQSEEQFAVALQNLREDLKEHRAETRQDIKDLEKKTDEWHDEVRKDFTDVKKRLTTIETQISTKQDAKRFGVERMASWGAILLVALGVFKLGMALETNHKETMAQVELNRQHVDVVAEQAVENAKKQP